MPTPKKNLHNRAGDDHTAFNLRLPIDLVKRLDAITDGGPVPLSRNQMIQRVLLAFVAEFESEQKGEPWSNGPRCHVIAGYLDWMEAMPSQFWKAIPKREEGADGTK